MPQNPIQFQPGMSLCTFIERFGAEAQCETTLEHARWPSGFVCPRCGGKTCSTFLADKRKYWQCSACRTQITLRSGTVFHASKVPLTKWFQAMYLVTQNKNNISSLSLKRHIGVSYTALLGASGTNCSRRWPSASPVVSSTASCWPMTPISLAPGPANPDVVLRTRPGSWRR